MEYRRGGSRSGCLMVLIVFTVATSQVTAAGLEDLLDTPEWLTVGGSHRIRFETLDNQLRANRRGGDQLLAVRTILRAEATLKSFDLVAEIRDARGFLNDRGSFVNTGSINTLELTEAHLRYQTNNLIAAEDEFELLLGRMRMDVGSRRLIGWQRFRNSTNAFTGLKSTWGLSTTQTLTLFYTYPTVRLPDDFDSLLDNDYEMDDADADLKFWGAHYATSSLLENALAEVYAFKLDERDDPRELATRNRNLTTVGVRLFRKPAPDGWDFDLEGGVQRGEARATTNSADRDDLDVRAHFVHLEAGYTFARKWSPRLALEYNEASGDKDPNDNEWGRFDALYGPVRSDLAPTGIWSMLARSNLKAPGISLELNPDNNSSLKFSYRVPRLAEDADVFGNTGVVDRSGAAGRDSGRQFEVMYRRWLIPQTVRIELGTIAFLTGSFFDRAPNANGNTDSFYGYGQIDINF